MKYPLGIQTFSHIREENYVYVDKTALIHQLITTGKTYFLSRPRRFGKSLLISTIEALFRGDKSLFEGLAIANADYEFTAHPVIKFEFSKDEFATADNLRDYINSAVTDIAEFYGIELRDQSYNLRFNELVVKLHRQTDKQVVLLIDEYDKPILNNLFEDELAEIKKVIAAFYGVIKPLDEHLKFVFITGVSKFAKISVFSSMNSLTDISMDYRYATLCGVTQQELESYFDKPIAELVNRQNIHKVELLTKIKNWYNGYYFEENAPSVYNPYSLLSLFSKQKFSNYWFTTATPTFLLELLKTKQYDLKDLTEFEVGDGAFAASEPENLGVQSVFLQTGYLTIKSYKEPLYSLNFPNYEVKKSFFDSVVTSYSQLDAGAEQSYIIRLLNQLKAQQFDDFFETLRVFFANIPYDITLKNEKYYQSLFFAIFKLIGFSIEAEVRTNKGRIDCVLETEDIICLIEFKLNGTKEQALQQILDTEYLQKYQLSDKQKVLIGVEFAQDSRNLGGYLCQSI